MEALHFRRRWFPVMPLVVSDAEYDAGYAAHSRHLPLQPPSTAPTTSLQPEPLYTSSLPSSGPNTLAAGHWQDTSTTWQKQPIRCLLEAAGLHFFGGDDSDAALAGVIVHPHVLQQLHFRCIRRWFHTLPVTERHYLAQQLGRHADACCTGNPPKGYDW
jgi:hypothetical protein